MGEAVLVLGELPLWCGRLHPCPWEAVVCLVGEAQSDSWVAPVWGGLPGPSAASLQRRRGWGSCGLGSSPEGEGHGADQAGWAGSLLWPSHRRFSLTDEPTSPSIDLQAKHVPASAVVSSAMNSAPVLGSSPTSPTFTFALSRHYSQDCSECPALSPGSCWVAPPAAPAPPGLGCLG